MRVRVCVLIDPTDVHKIDQLLLISRSLSNKTSKFDRQDTQAINNR
jgi:hypothetical protein